MSIRRVPWLSAVCLMHARNFTLSCFHCSENFCEHPCMQLLSNLSLVRRLRRLSHTVKLFQLQSRFDCLCVIITAL